MKYLKGYKLFESEETNFNEYYIDLIYLLQDVFEEFNIISKSDETNDDIHKFWSIRLKESPNVNNDGISDDISDISQIGNEVIKYIVIFNIDATESKYLSDALVKVKNRFKEQTEQELFFMKEEIDRQLYDYIIRVYPKGWH